MQQVASQIYFFDEFRLDLTRGALYRGVEEVKLRPKSFDVLKYLMQNHGRLVSKDELIEAVWHETAVTDDSLVQCLRDIRRALKDNAQEIIRTVPRRGYLFEKAVSENGVACSEELTSIRVVIEEAEDTTSDSSASRSGIAAAVTAIKQNKKVLYPVLVSVVLLGLWQIIHGPEKDSVRLFQNVELKTLTRTGNIVNTALSPDGKYAAYTTLDAGLQTLWLRQIATESAQQIIPPSETRYYGVVFSPDGGYVYFDRANALYRVPVLGGVPQKILTDLDWCPSFSADGRRLAFVRNAESRNESILMTANADGTEERQISRRPNSDPYGIPVWAPDGQTIAASAGNMELGDSFREVVAVNVADGSEKPVTQRKWYAISYLAWLADGSGLLMSANPEKSLASPQIWLLSYPEGTTRQITRDSYNYDYLSLSADSGLLLAHHTELLTHVWIVPDLEMDRPRDITSGLGNYKHIRWTPAGKIIVAAHGGSTVDLWQLDADGSHAKQLTANVGTNWANDISPDGRHIVCESDRSGVFHIWRMDADGGGPIQLTNGNGEKFPDISPDGKWVIYTAFMDWTLWKIPIEGGTPIQLTEKYAREASVSPDGKWIAYTSADLNQVEVIPFEGGDVARSFELPPEASVPQWVRWSPDSSSIVFVATNASVSNLWSLPLDGDRPAQITDFPSDRIFGYDWSADGKQLAVIRGAWTADMVLLSQK